MFRNAMQAVAYKLIARGVRLPAIAASRYQELSALRALLTQLDVNIVIDAGANRGQFANNLRRIGFRGRMVSFEPLEREFRELSRRFGSDVNWQGFKLALGSCAGTIPLHVDEQSSVLSSFLAPIDTRAVIRDEAVKVERLDDLFDQLAKGIATPRVFLKMDTQGYDLEVFRGAAGCLEAIVGLQSEISVQPIYRAMPHYLDALAEYERADFALVDLYPVSRQGSIGTVLELNCLMARVAAAS